MKYNIFKKILVLEVIGLLMILCIVPAFSSNYNMNPRETIYAEEENCLTEGFKEHKNLEYDLREEKHDKIHDLENLGNNRLCRQTNIIDHTVEEHSNFYDIVYPDFRSMKTDHGQNERDPTMHHGQTCFLIENSTICGYITDNATGEPIEEAHIIILWPNNQGIGGNYTYSNSLGFYSINVEAFH